MSSKLKVNNIIPSTGTQIGISTTGGGINLLTGTVVTGIITATGFSGAVTGTASGNPTLANGANNRVVTATGANALTGESDLTFDGTTVKILNTIPKIELNDGSGRILQIRGGSTSHNPSIITQYASGVYIGGKGVEGVGIGSTQLTITNGDLILQNSPHSITALGANSSTYGELNVEVAASDFSGSNNVATFKRGSNGAINLAFPSGGGIDFSATGDGAGTDTSELFDDYEEGSFLPTITFGGNSSGQSYSSRSGSYVKIGSFVYCVGQLDLSAKGSSTGAAAFANLPYAAGDHVSGSSHEGSGSITWWQAMGKNLNYPTSFWVSESGTAATIWEGNGSAMYGLDEGDFNNNSQFRFVVHYRTAT